MKLSDQLKMINRFRTHAPVDVEGLANALGIDVRYSFLEKGISGMLERLKDGSGYCITINASDPPTRQRFTIAHELGHYIFHRNLVGDGVDDDRIYRSTEVGRYHNTAIGPAQETEANAFAANLLMPHTLIKQERAELGGDNVAELARRFGVSEQAMSIRLGVRYDKATGGRAAPVPVEAV